LICFLGRVKASIIMASSYCLFEVFLVTFLGLLRGSNKGEESTEPVLALVEAYITLCSSNMFFLLVRVLIKGE
jgi:hypothetical protein